MYLARSHPWDLVFPLFVPFSKINYKINEQISFSQINDADEILVSWGAARMWKRFSCAGVLAYLPRAFRKSSDLSFFPFSQFSILTTLLRGGQRGQ